MKYLLIIGDGMADNPVESLGGKTPLQAAHKPTIDALAARGEVGNVKNVPLGLPAGSFRHPPAGGGRGLPLQYGVL